MSKNRNLKRQQEKKRIEEEEDNLLKTDKERELIGVNRLGSNNQGKNIRNQQIDNNQENEENEDLEMIEEGEQNEEEFNKLVNVHKLIQKNKITKQNAFDIDIGDVKLYNYSWVNSSNFLKNLSEIHGFKIDNIHQDSYKLLGLINRTDNIGEDDEQNENDNPNSAKKQKKFQDITVTELLKKTNKYKNIISIGDKTLEQRPEVLNVVKYDLEFDLDPLLKQTLSKFDDSSNKGLFLTNSYMDKNIIISLESELQEQNDIFQQAEEQKENLKISETQQEQEESKESIYMKFLPKDNIKQIFEQPQLCPKLMDYKENLEKLANAFKIEYQITDSNFQKLRLAPQQKDAEIENDNNHNQINDMPQDHFNYGDLMGQLDEIMDNPNQEEEYQDPNNPLDLQYGDLKKQDEQNQDIEEEDDEEEQDNQQGDEEEKENEQDQEEDLEEEQQENSQQEQLDILEMEKRLKSIGKGKLDKKLKDKMRAYEQNDEKKQRRKRNILEKLENQQQKHEKKKENEFTINFENYEEPEENKEICFGLNKKRAPKIDLKSININDKVVHQKLDTFNTIINEQLFTQLYLSDLPKELALQQQNENNQTSNLEDIEMNELLEEQFEEANSSDEEVDFFAQNNQNNEKSQVKIRDLKKNVWIDIKKRFDIIHKKSHGKKETKKKVIQQISDEVNFSTILEDIPQMMGPISKKISLQSSFITILHLCNENLLKLEMKEDCSDFQIIDDDKYRYDPKNQIQKIESNENEQQIQENKEGLIQNESDNENENKNDDNLNNEIEVEYSQSQQQQNGEPQQQIEVE